MLSGVWAKRRTSHSTLAKINYLFQEYEIYYIFLKLGGPAVNYPYKEIFWGLDFLTKVLGLIPTYVNFSGWKL
jgi:hypothetical protein